MALLYARTPLSVESIDIKEDFQLRFHSRERTAVLLHGWRDDREKETEKERERRRYKKVGSTRRECRLTDASVARASAMGKAAYLLEKSTLLQPPARLFEFAQLRPRFLHNANYKLCASLRSDMRASLFHSLQTFSRFTFVERERETRSQSVCTLLAWGGILCRSNPIFAAYISIADFSAIRTLPFSLSSFFLFLPRTKKIFRPCICTIWKLVWIFG